MLLPSMSKISKVINKPKTIYKNILTLYNILKNIKIEEKYINNKLYINVDIPKNILLNTGNIILTTQDCTIQTDVHNNCKLHLNPIESKKTTKWTSVCPNNLK